MAKVDTYPQTDSPPSAARQVTSTDLPSEDKVLLDVAVKEGNFTQQGLDSGLVTTLTVTTSATLLPSTAATNRNAIAIQNFTGATMYVGFSSGVTADRVVGTTSGYELADGGEVRFDITDTATIYGILAAGSGLVKVVELIT